MADITFKMTLPPNGVPNLVTGTLTFTDVDGDQHQVVATSGLPKHQYEKAWTQKGKGCLPPTAIIGQLYSVATRYVNLPTVVGVEGPFFPISPFSVTVGGVDRGDFGIHFDANVPGSSGCIVVPNKEQWQAVCYEFGRMQTRGTKSLSLEVIYP